MGEGRRIDKGTYYLLEGEKDAKGGKVYHCPVCDQGFSRAGSVTMHTLWKHRETPMATVTPKMGSAAEGKYKCPMCDAALVLLSRKDPRHAEAIRAGGVFVCTNPDCEEVLKGDGTKID